MGTTSFTTPATSTTTTTSTMKLCVVILAALCVGCYAPDLARLIQMEVQAIIHQDPNLTLDHCATKCDAEFDLIAGHDEQQTDMICKNACDWWLMTFAINHNCHGHASHPTHATHT